MIRRLFKKIKGAGKKEENKAIEISNKIEDASYWELVRKIVTTILILFGILKPIRIKEERIENKTNEMLNK